MKPQLNNLLIIACLALCSCSHAPSEKDVQQVAVSNGDSSITGIIQSNQRVGVWTELDKKKGIEVQSFYGYHKDTFEVEAARYYLKDDHVIDLYYQFGYIKDVDVKKYEAVSEVLPFLARNLGSQLFSTNCMNCHVYFPGMADQYFDKVVKRKYEEGSFTTFIREGRKPKPNDSLCIQHPEMYHLDTFEINAIVKFITVVDTGTVAGSR